MAATAAKDRAAAEERELEQAEKEGDIAERIAAAGGGAGVEGGVMKSKRE